MVAVRDGDTVSNCGKRRAFLATKLPDCRGMLAQTIFRESA